MPMGTRNATRMSAAIAMPTAMATAPISPPISEASARARSMCARTRAMAASRVAPSWRRRPGGGGGGVVPAGGGGARRLALERRVRDPARAARVPGRVRAWDARRRERADRDPADVLRKWGGQSSGDRGDHTSAHSCVRPSDRRRSLAGA